MIHVITAENRSRYGARLEEMFRLRYEIFIREMGWKQLARPDGRDVDAYDKDDTVYVLHIERGHVFAGFRLNPTAQAHMLGDIFGHLVEGDVPSGPNIFEWSRLFIIQEMRDGPTYCHMVSALQELCLDEGISHVTAVVPMWRMPRLQEMGFHVRPLGLPHPIDGTPTIALQLGIDQTTLRHARCLAGVEGKLLRAGQRGTVARRWPPDQGEILRRQIRLGEKRVPHVEPAAAHRPHQSIVE